MNVILFDENHINYYPLSFTRPISYFRIGVFSIKEKWEKYYNSVSVKTEGYLTIKFPLKVSQDNLWINSETIPSQELVRELNSLRPGEALAKDGKIFAFRNNVYNKERLNIIDSHSIFHSIKNLTDIFYLNSEEIKNDIKLLDVVKKQQNKVDLEQMEGCSGVVKIGDNPIYIEEGVKLQHCILNTSDGPIYIGKNVEIMEGSMVRGPFAILDNSVLKMGSRIYGGTTIGPYCKVGGEVNNTVFFGYSSKAHDGFLGNSVIGEWCNLGADTNSSNLKNNYAEVRLWNYDMETFKNTGLQFCGIIMGDHSKCGINTMFNTGTVIGVSANVFGSGFPRNFIPSFSWGGYSGFSVYRLSKVFDVVKKVFARRGCNFGQLDKDILTQVYDMTKRYRKE